MMAAWWRRIPKSSPAPAACSAKTATTSTSISKWPGCKKTLLYFKVYAQLLAGDLAQFRSAIRGH